MKKILFIEDQQYFDELGITEKINRLNYICHFNGQKKYKISDEEIRKYDYVISMLYPNPISNLLILKAKKNNVKTILVSDGIIDWANMFKNPINEKYDINLYHPIIHDIFLCMGEDEKNYFETINKNIEVIKYMPKRVLNARKKICMPENYKVLITTANTAYFDSNEKLMLIKLIKSVIHTLDKNKYSYNFRIFDKELIKEINIPEELNIIDGSFEEIISEFSSVITTPSSISLTSMYHDRAVGHLIYRDSPMFLQSGWTIIDGIDLENIFNSMKNRDINRMEFQRCQVYKYIDINELDSDEQLYIHKEKIDNSEIYKFIDKNLLNMLNSKFNFNLEFLVRKLYLNIKRNKLVGKYLKRIRKYIM